MKCPNCIETVEKSNINGYTVGNCLYCDGLWIDHEVIQQILESGSNKQTYTNFDIATNYQSTVDSSRSCPNCDIRLKILKYKNIELDICPECSGIFFDRGELKQIAPKISSISDEMKELGLQTVSDLITTVLMIIFSGG